MKTKPNVLKHPKVKNPVETLANTKHEFGEHGGVNMSIEASTTFTAMHPDILTDMLTPPCSPNSCLVLARVSIGFLTFGCLRTLVLVSMVSSFLTRASYILHRNIL